MMAWKGPLASAPRALSGCVKTVGMIGELDGRRRVRTARLDHGGGLIAFESWQGPSHEAVWPSRMTSASPSMTRTDDAAAGLAQRAELA